MGDQRNKRRKEQEAERTRQLHARLAPAPSRPFIPVCDGCGLTGLYNQSPDGGFIRIYSVGGGVAGAGEVLL
jgi:hypothetical protein